MSLMWKDYHQKESDRRHMETRCEMYCTYVPPGSRPHPVQGQIDYCVLASSKVRWRGPSGKIIP